VAPMCTYILVYFSRPKGESAAGMPEGR